MGKPRDMTAFCKVTVVSVAAPGDQGPPPPKARGRPRKPPVQARREAAKGEAAKRKPGPADAPVPAPAPAAGEALQFSHLDGEESDGVVEDELEWEEVHDDLGDRASDTYPSEDEAGSVPSVHEEEPPRQQPAPRPPVQYTGKRLKRQALVF